MSPKLKVHQHDDTPARSVGALLVFSALFVPLCSLLVWLAYTALGYDTNYAPQYAKQQPLDAPGQPHLQAHPEEDLTALLARMNKQLETSGWVNREAAIVHIPIARAMDLLADQGLAKVEESFATEATQVRSRTPETDARPTEISPNSNPKQEQIND